MFKFEKKTNIVLIYKVTLPSWVCWPGVVTLNISYTRAAAEQFIEDYPNKWMVPWMKIETQEIIQYQETD